MNTGRSPHSEQWPLPYPQLLVWWLATASTVGTIWDLVGLEAAMITLGVSLGVLACERGAAWGRVVGVSALSGVTIAILAALVRTILMR